MQEINFPSNSSHTQIGCWKILLSSSVHLKVITKLWLFIRCVRPSIISVTSIHRKWRMYLILY